MDNSAAVPGENTGVVADAKKIISLDLILKKNVPSCYKAGEQQPDVVESVLSLKRVWLDNLLITNIDNLEMLGNVSHLYLQDNNIATIENLETIGTTLQHLNLKNNLITELGDTLICLDRLMSLDISSNRIECIEHKQLPQKITFLNIACNPCMDNGGFDKEAVIENLINLKMIDNEELESEEDSDEEEREEEENKLKANSYSLEKIDEGAEEEMSVMYDKMMADSKCRQNNFDDHHKVRLETLHQIRNNMESHSVRESVELVRSSLDNIDMIQHRDATTILNRGPAAVAPEMMSPLPTPELKRQNTLPPLDRPLSSKSSKSTKKKSLQKLDKPSSPKTPAAPRGQGLSNTDLSLRPTLDQALVSCNDMEDYVKNVQGMFDGIQTDMNKLRD